MFRDEVGSILRGNISHFLHRQTVLDLIRLSGMFMFELLFYPRPDALLNFNPRGKEQADLGLKVINVKVLAVCYT